MLLLVNYVTVNLLPKEMSPTRCRSATVLEVGDGVFEVLSTSGDTHLGGDDFDKVSIFFLFLSLCCVWYT